MVHIDNDIGKVIDEVTQLSLNQTIFIKTTSTTKAIDSYQSLLRYMPDARSLNNYPTGRCTSESE